MNQRLLLVWSLGVASVLLEVSSAQAWCAATTDLNGSPEPGGCCVNTGKPLKWPTRETSYAIYMSGSQDLSLEQVRAAAKEAFGKWEGIDCDGQPTGVQARLLDETSDEWWPDIDAGYLEKNTIVFADDWHDRGPGHGSEVYALTTVWHNTRTGRIYGADMEINQETYFLISCPASGCDCNVRQRSDRCAIDDSVQIQVGQAEWYSPYCPGGDCGCEIGSSSIGYSGCAIQRDGRRGPVDVMNVFTHEAGHYFGLAHSCEPEATMWPSAECCESIRATLAPDDKDGFCHFYKVQDDGCSCTASGQLSGSKRTLVVSMLVLGLLAFVRAAWRRRSGQS